MPRKNVNARKRPSEARSGADYAKRPAVRKCARAACGRQAIPGMDVCGVECARLLLADPSQRRKRPATIPIPQADSPLEADLIRQLRAMGEEPLRRQYVFDERFGPADFADPEAALLVEVEGGTRLAGGGRHNRATGYAKDCLKYNRAAALGWAVLRYTGDQVESGHAARDITEYRRKYAQK